MTRLCILLLFSSLTAAAQGFSIVVPTGSRTISVGEQASFPISILPSGGFSAPVALDLYGTALETITRDLDRDTMRAPYHEIATIRVSAVRKPGTYTINIRAISGSITMYSSVRLVVDRRVIAPPVRWTLYDAGNSELPDPLIRTIAFDPIGNAWVGTASGLVHVGAGEMPGEVVMERNTIYAVAIDTTRAVWISSLSGLSRYSNGSLAPFRIPDSIPLFGSAILRIANSPDGSQWLVTRFGLVRHRYGVWTKYTAANSGLTSDILIDAGVTSTGDLWAAVDAGGNGAEPGLVKFDGTAWTPYSMTDLGLRPDALPSGIAIDRADHIWLVTDDGLVVADPSGFRREDPGFVVNAIAGGADGRIWVSSADVETGARKLASFRDGAWTTYDDAGSGLRSGASFDHLAVDDHDGSIWIGSEGGLVIFRPDITARVESRAGAAIVSLTIAPNPLRSEGTIDLVSGGGMARIRLYDNTGRAVANVFQGRLEAGRTVVALDRGTLPDGTCLLVLEIDGVVVGSRMVVLSK